MKKLAPLLLLPMLLSPSSLLTAEAAENVYMANGIKIGEVTSDSAIIWVRLTKHPERNIDGKPFPKNDNKKRRSLKYDDLDAMEGSVPGTVGEVRIALSGKGTRPTSGWVKVKSENDFIYQKRFSNLRPAARYRVTVEGRALESKTPSCSVEGSFQTPGTKQSSSRTVFTVVTGQDYPRRDDSANGHRIYPSMKKLHPDFFVHTGDIEYYDKPRPYADNRQLARFKWARLFSMPFQREFHRDTASYFLKDDHDTLKNDAWPGQKYGDLTWDQGVALFREQFPLGDKTYRTVRWGKDLQVWMVEGRDFRSPNNMPDGPDKSIWGKEQKAWLKRTVEASDATFRILISPTPIVGPDRGNKNDNHANKGFTHEGDEIRAFIASQKNMYIVCGDRHWQYVSVDPKTGVKEFSCGPTTDKHASGFSQKNRSEMHKYLKIKGGFLSATIDRKNGKPFASFKHHDTYGGVYNEELIEAKK
jgi:alkaline phosphatase D